jgi:PleD family two-component response regulator
MAVFEMDKFFSTIEHTAMKLVLVVEANTEIGPLLVQAINEETPYQAFLVTNAVQALQIAGEIVPDLLLLDFQLPDIEGFELYKVLHGMERLEYVPVILISVSTSFPLYENEQQKIPCFQIPLELDGLLLLIRELIT